MHHPILYSRDRMAARPRRAAVRSAFTLIEMLVVLAIMTALLSLVALVAPRFGERQRPSRGAGQLQSWLNLAKNRALRDQRPRGIRLPPVTGTVIGSNASPTSPNCNTSNCPKCSPAGSYGSPYNIRPQPIATATVTSSASSWRWIHRSDPIAIPFDRVTCSKSIRPIGSRGGFRAVTQINNDPRFAGQTIYLLTLNQDLGGPYPLTTPAPPPPPRRRRERIRSQPPPPTEAYRILRQDRRMPGEPVLTLPKDVGIDISRGPPVSASDPTPTFYRLFPARQHEWQWAIRHLFDPSGRLIGRDIDTRQSGLPLGARYQHRTRADAVARRRQHADHDLHARTGQITAAPRSIRAD